MVSQLNTAQREQARGGEQILQAVEQLREITRKQETRFARAARKASRRWRRDALRAPSARVTARLRRRGAAP